MPKKLLVILLLLLPALQAMNKPSLNKKEDHLLKESIEITANINKDLVSFEEKEKNNLSSQKVPEEEKMQSIANVNSKNSLELTAKDQHSQEEKNLPITKDIEKRCLYERIDEQNPDLLQIATTSIPPLGETIAIQLQSKGASTSKSSNDPTSMDTKASIKQENKDQRILDNIIHSNEKELKNIMDKNKKCTNRDKLIGSLVLGGFCMISGVVLLIIRPL